MRKYILIIFLLLSLHGLYAQQAPVVFKATPSRTKIGVNEKLRVEFSMNQDGDNFSPPTFQGFSVSGPGQMISNSWVNGVRSFSKSYTYVLQPKAKGTYTITQATIEIGGVTYKTSPFKVVVGDAVANPNPQPPAYNPYNPYNPYGGQQQQQQQPAVAQNPGDGIHLVAEVANTSPYVNQPVNVVYKLYVSQNASVSNFFEKKSPQYNDFWSQIEIVDGQHMKVEMGTYKGQSYRFVTLRKAVLYPQKSGKLFLEPLVVEVNSEVLTGYDPFGRPQTKPAKIDVTTGRKSFNVRPLPEAGKPDSFTGAVGNFDFSVTPSKTTITNGEAITLTVKASGKGNLKLFNLPKPEVPASLEMYDPEHKEDVKTPLTGMVGSIADVYNIVPNAKGKFVIKGVEFSWFDLASNSYKTKKTDDITINVLNVPASATAAANQPKSKTQAQAGESFRSIATSTSLKAINSDDFFGSTLFYILLFLPFGLIPVVVLLKKKKEAYDSDVTGNKIRKNNKLARKYLSEAKKQMGNKEPFYLALEKALHNFLKAKLSIETSELSRENITELLLERNAKPETVQEFSTIMDACEFARYAPATSTAMQQDYDKAVSVITNLAKQV